MRNIKLVIEYDGSAFHGWQKQEGKRTIQNEIEKTLKNILKEEIEIFGAGRTDSGVHALNQVANFNTNNVIPKDGLLSALNSMLPQDISIKTVEEVPIEFHSRKSAKAKRYRYVINNTKVPSALNRRREYFYRNNLSIEAMKLAIKDLIGTYDFAGFRSSGSSVKNTVRTIYDVQIEAINGRLVIELYGNGFLYNMVRIIVGTLIDIGTGKSDICVIKNVLETKDRKLAGQTVPPQGLYLVNVEY